MRSINPLVMHQWLALAEPHGSRLRAPLGGSARNYPSLRATDHARDISTYEQQRKRERPDNRFKTTANIDISEATQLSQTSTHRLSLDNQSINDI